MMRLFYILTLVILMMITGSCGETHSASERMEMHCIPKAATNRVSHACITRHISEREAKVICDSLNHENDTRRTYSCSYASRDWAQQSSPYAHTSRIWQCSTDALNTYVFDQDFIQDTSRCDLLCGRCETGWQQTKSKR